MRVTTLIATLALTGGILGAGATLVPAFAQSDAPAAAQSAQSNWMSIDQVHSKLQAAGYRDINDIERENGRYEVKAIDAEGRKVKLKFDAVSGEILSPTAGAAQAKRLSIDEVNSKLQAAGYRDVEKIERDGSKYEAYATDGEGRRVELKLDAVSGEILKTEVKRAK